MCVQKLHYVTLKSALQLLAREPNATTNSLSIGHLHIFYSISVLEKHWIKVKVGKLSNNLTLLDID